VGAVKVLSIVGNRPQFVKSAPLSVALREARVDEVVLHTGQHWDRELSQVFFDELGLTEPRYRLELHTRDVDTMRGPIADAVSAERPDWVLVYGDTNSTLAGAQAAGATPVAHVEAGLRSFDLAMPEERNRIEVDRIAALLLAPDDRSARQLESEGVGGRSEVVGDVMADAARIFTPIAARRSRILERLGLAPRDYVVATIHREGNVTDPERLANIADALRTLDRRVVFPAHPRTRAALAQLGIELPLIAPLGYLDFAALASQARVIVTDSGGLQKEAYWYRIPCVTVRRSTEWVDTVANGANTLVEPDGIAAAVSAARFPDDAPPLYGDGYASGRVAAALYASTPS
jgi:UDP-N-acetylglucosamine 2-epimerase